MYACVATSAVMTIAIRRFRSGGNAVGRERGRRAWKVSAGCAPRIRGGFNWREKQTSDEHEYATLAVKELVSAEFVFLIMKLANKSDVCSLPKRKRSRRETDFMTQLF